MKIEDVLKKCLKEMAKYDDRKSLSEGLLITILHELSEINKKLPEKQKVKSGKKK